MQFFNLYIGKIHLEIGECITATKNLNKTKKVEGCKWMQVTRGKEKGNS